MTPTPSPEQGRAVGEKITEPTKNDRTVERDTTPKSSPEDERDALWQKQRDQAYESPNHSPVECDGGPNCKATTHLHGCYAPRSLARRVQVGGFCVKGGGHVWTYEEGPDGCSGWDLFIEVDPEDIHLFPEWVQEAYRDAR